MTIYDIKNETINLTPVVGNSLQIGHGFTALGFRHSQFDGVMDPLIMVDHYTMTEPTFGVHPHAGISAVSILFEDSQGKFNNRDSLGNDFDIEAGDLYWLNAGRGALHDEAPRTGAKIHGLQVFVNLPASLKHSAPSSLHIKRSDMPTIEDKGYRVRVVLGESNGQYSYEHPVWPVSILDGYADNRANFVHQVQVGCNTWIYAVEHDIEYRLGKRWEMLKQGTSIAVTYQQLQMLNIRGTAINSSHFAVISGQPIAEPFVQQGPFAMTTQQEIDELVAKYEAGEFGQIDK